MRRDTLDSDIKAYSMAHRYGMQQSVFYSTGGNYNNMQRVIKKINRARSYLFKLPTKSIELLSGLCSMFFGLVFIVNGRAIKETHSFVNFEYIGPDWIWWLVLLLGIMQLNAMRKDTLESNIMSAICLKVSSLVSFVIALMFASNFPPISTGFFTYTILSGLYILAGIELSEQNTYELLIRSENRMN